MDALIGLPIWPTQDLLVDVGARPSFSFFPAMYDFFLFDRENNQRSFPGFFFYPLKIFFFPALNEVFLFLFAESKTFPFSFYSFFLRNDELGG